MNIGETFELKQNYEKFIITLLLKHHHIVDPFAVFVMFDSEAVIWVQTPLYQSWQMCNANF